MINCGQREWNIMMGVFWNVTPCIVIDRYHGFGGNPASVFMGEKPTINIKAAVSWDN
jgi:hypothetical protein